jgi:hypothetical protein
MITKQQLEEIKQLDDAINIKLSEIEALRDIATSISAVLKDEVVQSSKQSDKVASCVAKIIDLETEVNELTDRLIDTREMLLKEITRILGHGAVEFKVIYLKYFKYERQGDICSVMHYTRESVRQIEMRALKKLEDS